MRKLFQKKYWLDHVNDKKYVDFRNKILDAYKDLVFIEEGHQYFVGDRELTSVSVMTHMFKEHFDDQKIAQETYERNFNNSKSKYFHMTTEEILQMWKDISKHSCEHGTERHEFGESVFYFMTKQYDKILPAFKDRLQKDEDTGMDCFVALQPKEEAVVKVYEDMPDFLIPILAETKVYNITDEYAYSGTFDILFYLEYGNKSGFYVLDWKTNKDLYKNYDEKKLLSPFNELLDMPLSMYKLQLSAYQMPLEKLGFKVIRRELFWLRPNATYEKIKLEDLTKQLHKALLKEGKKLL